MKYAKIKGRANGKIKRGVIFSTYSSLIGESTSAAKAKYKSRIKQLVHWCGKDFDGVVSELFAQLTSSEMKDDVCYHVIGTSNFLNNNRLAV